MEIRWLGHSAFEIISDDDVKILIDPFISNNPACQIPVEEINPDIILSFYFYLYFHNSTLIRFYSLMVILIMLVML